jgi:hypothetical protein
MTDSRSWVTTAASGMASVQKAVWSTSSHWIQPFGSGFVRFELVWYGLGGMAWWGIYLAVDGHLRGRLSSLLFSDLL